MFGDSDRGKEVLAYNEGIEFFRIRIGGTQYHAVGVSPARSHALADHPYSCLRVWSSGCGSGARRDDFEHLKSAAVQQQFMSEAISGQAADLDPGS